MLQKSLNLEFKALDDATGVFECHAAAFGNIDRVGDIIVRGAFLDTLATFIKEGIILWNHDTDTPIGRPLDAHEDELGLWVKGQILLSTAKGREVYELLKAGVITKFSIGYDVLEREWLYEENLAQYAPADATTAQIAKALAYGAALKKIELYEISPVSIPANPQTSLDSIKSAKAVDLAALASRKDLEGSAAQLAEIKARQVKRRHAARRAAAA